MLRSPSSARVWRERIALLLVASPSVPKTQATLLRRNLFKQARKKRYLAEARSVVLDDDTLTPRALRKSPHGALSLGGTSHPITHAQPLPRFVEALVHGRIPPLSASRSGVPLWHRSCARSVRLCAACSRSTHGVQPDVTGFPDLRLAQGAHGLGERVVAVADPLVEAAAMVGGESSGSPIPRSCGHMDEWLRSHPAADCPRRPESGTNLTT